METHGNNGGTVWEGFRLRNFKEAEEEARALKLDLPLVQSLSGSWRDRSSSRMWVVNGSVISLSRREYVMARVMLGHRVDGGSFMPVPVMQDAIETLTAGQFWESPEECDVRRTIGALRAKLRRAGFHDACLSNLHSRGYRISTLSSLIHISDD